MSQQEPSTCPHAAEAQRTVDSLRHRVMQLEDEVRQMRRDFDYEHEIRALWERVNEIPGSIRCWPTR